MSNTTKDYLFVGIQLVLFVAYAFNITKGLTHFPDWLQYLGLVMVVAGIGLASLAMIQIRTSFSPFPTPVEDGQLISNGAFSVARHPIYTGILLAAFGYAFYTAYTDKLIWSVLLLILFYFKSSYEEQLLSQKYAGYADYKKRVGRFTPWW
ncbi:methyltransferase family protein [Neolewinella agarilytica]|uniref:Protein-S-isoprenylcysteine O-methyltransferase Ste14 n=1 Tax=Neolewinella agarilytica TaxID=478744 RepID=A0A1H9MD38_9BACT|nr:isoprenylcysteine carboxylmethyltransferase family protein [Neolewinella agarilytica]SER21584.1 Protein-S-isoprenylcysteine O-methyltransferase Ste14 [Neolewinella agarilytica]